MCGAGNVYSLHLRAYGVFIHGFQFLAWHGDGAGLLPLSFRSGLFPSSGSEVLSLGVRYKKVGRLLLDGVLSLSLSLIMV